MSKDNNLHDFLQDVADAIKEKKGSNDAINAQDFSDEIKNLPSGSSPFAVDFGEEIATGNPTFINALQEDIDYYNEVVRSIESGENVGEDYVTGVKSEEFKERIAWWPKIIDQPSIIKGFTNLRVLELTDNVTNIEEYNCIDTLILGGSKLDYYGFTIGTNNVKKIVCPKGKDGIRILGLAIHFGAPIEVNLNFVKYSEDARQILSNKFIKYAYGIDISNSTRASDLANMITNAYNPPQLVYAEFKGLRADLDISTAKKLSLISVKYILDNCLTRDDGASYTLTIDASVKTAFLAKCDEDAEYAASLASANAKGLTLA